MSVVDTRLRKLETGAWQPHVRQVEVLARSMWDHTAAAVSGMFAVGGPASCTGSGPSTAEHIVAGSAAEVRPWPGLVVLSSPCGRCRRRYAPSSPGGACGRRGRCTLVWR